MSNITINKEERVAKRKYKTGEDRLYGLLEANIGLVGGVYVDVPDAITTRESLIAVNGYNQKKRYTMTEKKRPFDCVLIFPDNTICVECKYMYNHLEPHQKEIGRKMDAAVPERMAWCVIRMIEHTSKVTLRTSVKYQIEDYERNKLFVTDNFIEMLKWLKNANNKKTLRGKNE